jgi:hypothetical protein
MAASALMECLSKLTHVQETDFKSPFVLVVDGIKWSVASDRKWVVAVRGAGPYLPWESSQERLTRVRTLLTMEPSSEAATVPVAEVLAWAGPQGPDILPGRLCGVLVDANRVSRLLTGLPFSKILVWDASELAQMPALGFSAGGRWKAILAGVRDDVDPQIDSFDPTLGRKVFDMLMDDG